MRKSTPYSAGDRFNRWTLIERIDRGYWRAQCDCGRFHQVLPHNLRSGKSSQCRNCATRAARLNNPHTTNQMVVTGVINRLPKLTDDQIERLLQSVISERDIRDFNCS